MLRLVDGDLLKATENIICQQVNCFGVMGGGVAHQAALLYPSLRYEYKKHCKSFWDSGQEKDLLGQVLYLRVHLFPRQIMALMFSQFDYRFEPESNGVNTDYEKLEVCFQQVKTFAKNKSYTVCAPYNIGCGLARGDWNIVSKIIEKVFDDCDITLYKLDV